MSRAMCHTGFRKGSHVWVQMNNGEKFSDKYVERKGRFVYLKEVGKLLAKDIRAMSYYRKQSED